MHTHIFKDICMFVWSMICICVCIYVCMHVRRYVYTFACMKDGWPLCIFVHVYASEYLFINNTFAYIIRTRLRHASEYVYKYICTLTCSLSLCKINACKVDESTDSIMPIILMSTVPLEGPTCIVTHQNTSSCQYFQP
jgi:hypothetical protein